MSNKIGPRAKGRDQIKLVESSKKSDSKQEMGGPVHISVFLRRAIEKIADGCAEGEKQECSSSSIESQQLRIIKRLLRGPASTLQLRRDEDVLGVAPRIFELRHEYGVNIKTHWICQETESGRVHRVALYVLYPGRWRRVR